jgi:tRNA nucleotidyltransferase (CCA-adding enzyme)
MKTSFENTSKDIQDLLALVGREADAAGVRAFLVGGVVRDLFLKRASVDVDVVVEGDGHAFARRLAGVFGVEPLLHQQFKTAVLKLPQGGVLDVVTARFETYSRPGALPVVEQAGISADLFRRDFSVNAIAVSLNADRLGEVEDSCGGMGDIEKKIIRVMHDQSFLDDPTRILRAVRYAARFGFKIEPHTLLLMKEAIASSALSTVTPVRYFHEFRRIFFEKDPLVALNTLHHLGGVLYFVWDRDVIELMRIAIDYKAVDAVSDPWILFLMCMCASGEMEAVDRVLVDFGLPKDVKQKVAEALQFETVLDMLVRDQDADITRFCMEARAFFYLKAEDTSVKRILKESLVK